MDLIVDLLLGSRSTRPEAQRLGGFETFLEFPRNMHIGKLAMLTDLFKRISF